ncbi:hypothetical protein BpHYR1_047153 [Brachionus plicatilis]|uniref:Uncharacterized protein n=1 Tax=Brachionus plicatilis TaxID=10195 RepID=A0A3M7P8X7_BRAPC|nr:hypothetical protein BpHYR1_047153 [Brachionus plicatilis]
MSQINNSISADDCMLNDYMNKWEKEQKLCTSFGSLKLQPTEFTKLDTKIEAPEEKTDFLQTSASSSYYFLSTNKK